MHLCILLMNPFLPRGERWMGGGGEREKSSKSENLGEKTAGPIPPMGWGQRLGAWEATQIALTSSSRIGEGLSN